jgi:DNA-binding IclR family transcriptional regulator
VKQLSDKLKRILEFICDGKCHSLFELQMQTKISENQAKKAVEFLSEYGFVEKSGRKGKVRISNIAKELFTADKTL